MKMISLTSSLSLNILLPQPRLQSGFIKHKPLCWTKKQNQVRKSIGKCKAELAYDAPFAFAIGSCVLNSLVFPVAGGSEEEDGGNGAIDSTDTSLAVMGIISFVPYFNWLGWIFAYLDTDRPRYLVYSIVYLVPYLRTNLSLSPEDSWLPIASIIFCIIHIQLEASTKSVDLRSHELLGEALKHLPLMSWDTNFHGYRGVSRKGRNEVQVELPSAHEEFKKKIPGWQLQRKNFDDDAQHLTEDGNANETEKR